jgi:DNA-binding PadR family transcriptional regulator
MFGMRHHHSHCEERWAGRRAWRRHGGFGFGGRHGMGGGDMIRAGRMLATGDLRLIALALIAEQPRHGYEIIKVLEEKTAGWYSPSPGIVYPTLTYLEEAGYVTAQAEGAKKLYTITEEGRAHLEDNRDFVDAVLERLAAVGRRITRMRRRFGEDEHEPLPRLVRAALDNLREAAGKRLEDDAEAEAKIVDILARAAADIRRN